jgi:hypothetical protein
VHRPGENLSQFRLPVILGHSEFIIGPHLPATRQIATVLDGFLDLLSYFFTNHPSFNVTQTRRSIIRTRLASLIPTLDAISTATAARLTELATLLAGAIAVGTRLARSLAATASASATSAAFASFAFASFAVAFAVAFFTTTASAISFFVALVAFVSWILASAIAVRTLVFLFLFLLLHFQTVVILFCELTILEAFRLWK